jgi:ADP-dependent NAD(P)H-hydrate dehydratase / NAD(P)H-hydrate epimerase
MKVLTASEMREVDRLTTERHGIPSLTLMENAGRAVGEFVRARFPHLERRNVVVLCGKGNNGGDGFVVARHLLQMGVRPVVFLFAAPEEMHGDADANRRRYQESGGDLRVVRDSGAWQASKSALGSAHIIVDALLGTGVRGRVEGLLRDAIDSINLRQRSAAIIAVDIPSGLSSDEWDPMSDCVTAEHTVTFTAPKLGMLQGLAERFVGELHVCDIGSPHELIDEIGKGRARWLEPREFSAFAAPRKPSGHKGDYGHALIVAGSVGKSGAAVLASWAALRTGAGLVTCATPEPVLASVAAHTPEIMTEPLAATEAGTIAMRCFESGEFGAAAKGKRAIGIGPGLSTHPETQRFVRAALANREIPIILDADGINAFAGSAGELRNDAGGLVITPHPGEMARLLGCETKEIQSRRIEVAVKAAAEANAVVVLKGHQTVVGAPDGRVYVNSTGNPGMGTGGTGDVLTGILAGLVAQYGHRGSEVPLERIVAFGVYLHGLAGDIAYAGTGEAPLMASDLIYAIPRAYRQFFDESGRG